VVLNKDAAFTEKEREILGLRGLLPAPVQTMEEQVLRILENFRKKLSNLEKYLFMIGLQDCNKTLFYRVVIDYIQGMTCTVFILGLFLRRSTTIKWLTPRG
jgi:malate dehydrogenase (oxaloacetate-decarboxylating)(NADP+)